MTPTETLREWRSNLVPRSVLLGAVLGFLAMCGLGRYVARIDYHPGFVRFNPSDAPDEKYYPTVNEMMAIVRHQIKPGQILVVVGGNSVLLGVGQPADHIWTKQLQADLGDRYFVVNFAFRGAASTNCGAVVAEALRKEFPKQILIANLPPTQMGYPTGSEVYRYNNWEAYYKGLLIDDPVRDAEIKAADEIPEYRNREFAVPELRLREWLDSLFYFQDLWNWFTFTQVNTVWGAYFPGTYQFQDPIRFLDPRSVYKDTEPDFLTMPMASRYIADNASIQGEMDNVRGVSMYAFNKDKNGQWVTYQPLWDQFKQQSAAAFPQELKKRTLILMGYNSPFYLSRLPPDDLIRNDLSFKKAVVEWEKNGYEALAYGKDFTMDDDGDRTHLTWHGGVKLAKVVAAKVQDMSQKLGYLSP
jgi:hypothetical protein